MAGVVQGPTISYSGGQAKAVADATRALQDRKATYQTRQAVASALEIGLAGVVGSAEELRDKVKDTQDNIDVAKLSITSNTAHAADKYVTVSKTNAANADTDLQITVASTLRQRTTYLTPGGSINADNITGIAAGDTLGAAGQFLDIRIADQFFRINANQTISQVVAAINNVAGGPIASTDATTTLDAIVTASVARDAMGSQYIKLTYKDLVVPTGQLTPKANILEPAECVAADGANMSPAAAVHAVSIGGYTFNIPRNMTVDAAVAQINGGIITSTAGGVRFNTLVSAKRIVKADGNHALQISSLATVPATEADYRGKVTACTLNGADITATACGNQPPKKAVIIVNGVNHESTTSNEIAIPEGYVIEAKMPHASGTEKVIYQMRAQVAETLQSTMNDIVNQYNTLAKFVAEHPNHGSRAYAAAQAMVSEMYSTLLGYSDYGIAYKNQTVAAGDGSTTIVRLVTLDTSKIQTKIAADINVAKAAIAHKRDTRPGAHHDPTPLSLTEKFLTSLARLDDFTKAKTAAEKESREAQEKVTALEAKIQSATDRALKMQARIERMEADMKQYLDFLDALYGVKN